MNPNVMVMAVIRIIFGAGSDGPQIGLTPDGKIVHIPGWNPENWEKLSPASQDILVCMAINELASLVHEPSLRSDVQNVVIKGVKGRAQQVTPAQFKVAA
jgi:hypothetical protein